MINKENNFLVVGLGLMGGSYSERLTEKGYKVYAIDINQESLEIGKRRKMILNQDESEEELIRKADYIILGLRPTLCLPWIKEHVKLLKKGAIITDMMGVKSHFVKDIQDFLVDQELISMHPMTGKEVSGVAYASSNIFNSSNMLIVPTSKNTERGKEFAHELGTILGVKNITEVSIEEHDKVVGYVSHLSHVISVILMTCFDSKSIATCAGTAFKDITRIANINEDIWSEIFKENQDELLPLIDSFETSLKTFKEALEKGELDKIKEILKESKNKRLAYIENK